jgi:hypothetical protein
MPTGVVDTNMEARRMDILSPSHAPDSPNESVATYLAKHDKPDAIFDMAKAPHGIALLLELANVPWEEAQAWSKYLFGNGLDSQVIDAVLSEGMQYLAIENVVRLPRRLVVSNIAADAREEDLKEFFHQYRFLV